MDEVGFDELAALLQRADVLFACREGPVDRTTISERADCSRATAYRAIANFEDRGYVEKQNGGYRLTALGSATVENIRHLQSGVAGVQNAAPVLEYVNEAVLIDAVHEFGDAEVYEATSAVPDLVEEQLFSMADRTETRLMAATSSSSAAVTTKWCCDLVGPNVDIHHILTPTALADLQTHHREADSDESDIDETVMYLIDEIPIDLMIFDDTLVVLGPDDENDLVAAIAVIDNQKALNWARTHIVWRRDNGERLAK